ncbi:hypothetical protein [Corallococcus sp. AB049A]|uniref:hypothetical protein n=1 Tax=Corallococcus sp. AB049A TaxID=2316721 RepID=UPI0011C35829|nr:hypothetical protein [Corallococcus sp. AB049A]
MKELTAAFRALVREVELTEIMPLGFLAGMIGPAPEPGAEVAFEVKPTLSTARTGEGEHGFMVRGDFVITVRQDTGADEQEDPFLNLRYTVAGRYAVPDNFAHSLDDALLRQFAETNAMMHLWPYLRAYVSNSCAQFGLPGLMLPVLRQPSAKRATAHRSE